MKSGARVNRYDFIKSMTGAAVSIAFAAVVFGPLGFGLRYTDELERRARAALEARNLDRIDVAVVRDPALQRDLVLSGTVDPQRQRQAVAVVRAVPGAADVRWASATRAGSGPSGLSARY